MPSWDTGECDTEYGNAVPSWVTLLMRQNVVRERNAFMGCIFMRLNLISERNAVTGYILIRQNLIRERNTLIGYM